MTTLHAWYDVDAEEPTVITTAAELDAVLDAVAAQDGPTIVQLLPNGDLNEPELHVGLHGDRGTLRYASDLVPNGSFSKSTGPGFAPPEDGEVLYFFMMSDNPYPPDSEIPATDVRKAAHQFMNTDGARPFGIMWNEVDGPL